MRRGCIEIDTVAGFKRVVAICVPYFKFALKKIEKLIAGMDMGSNLYPFAYRHKLGEIRVQLPIRHHVGQALEVISRVVDARLRQTHALRTPMHSKERMRLGFEKVGEVASKDHRDTGQVAQGGNYPAGLELRKKTCRQPG